MSINNVKQLKQLNSNSNVQISELELEISEVQSLQKMQQLSEQNLNNFNTQSIEQELQILNQKLNLFKSDKRKSILRNSQKSSLLAAQYQSANTVLTAKQHSDTKTTLTPRKNQELLWEEDRLLQKYNSLQETARQGRPPGQSSAAHELLPTENQSQEPPHVTFLHECQSVQQLQGAADNPPLSSNQLKLLRQFSAHRHSVNCICYDVNSMVMFSGSSDYAINTWDIRRARHKGKS